jgi:Xaa-Pro dipeptidase
MKERIRRIFEKIDDIDTIVLKNHITPHHDLSFFYVTGFIDGLYNNTVAIINRDLDMEVITSPLEADTARAEGVDVTTFESPAQMEDILKDRLSSAKGIGINGSELVYEDYALFQRLLPDTNIENVSTALNAARAVKDGDEIELIRRSCAIVSRIADAIPDQLGDSTVEQDIAAFILGEMLKDGASGPAFDTNCSFGANSALPHYHTGKAPIKEGDFVLTDFGSMLKRYSSDITRTWFFRKVDDEQRKIYETVLEAQQTAIDMIRPGVTGAEIHDAVSAVVNKAGYEGKFTHSTGHGIGLNVHDANMRIHTDVELTLEEGMVFTVEPGIYVVGFGGVRIEDDVAVTSDGCEVLTKADKELRIV